jgi:hypothetical protein
VEANIHQGILKMLLKIDHEEIEGDEEVEEGKED